MKHTYPQSIRFQLRAIFSRHARDLFPGRYYRLLATGPGGRFASIVFPLCPIQSRKEVK